MACQLFVTKEADRGIPGILLLKEWVDGFVLRIEVAHVHDQVLDDKHVRQGCHLGLRIRRPLHLKTGNLAPSSR